MIQHRSILFQSFLREANVSSSDMGRDVHSLMLSFQHFTTMAAKHGSCLLTLTKRIQAFETKCMRKLLRISFLGAQGKRLGAEEAQLPCWSTGTLLATVKRRKLAWFRHVTRHESLSKTIPQGTLEGGRRRGRQRKFWMNNIKE